MINRLLLYFLPLIIAFSFEALWLPLSGRPGAVRDPVLAAVAQAHAEELCYRYLTLGEPHGVRSLHVGLDGSMPNDRARAAGYDLPDWYPAHDNYIESVAVDHRGPASALQILLDSPHHYDHITGQGWFFSEQTHYGIGTACGAWYVLVTAPPEEGG